MTAWHLHEWANYAVCFGGGMVFMLLVSFFRKQ